MYKVKNIIQIIEEKKKTVEDSNDLFVHEEEDYCKAVREVIFGVTIILNIKVIVIEKTLSVDEY